MLWAGRGGEEPGQLDKELFYLYISMSPGLQWSPQTNIRSFVGIGLRRVLRIGPG